MYITINVKNKVAVRQDDVSIVCGNSDYVIQFTFDAEWEPYETKTARFVTDVGYTDVVFSGNEVPVPVITDAISVRVGVYAGNLHTTTPAVIFCRRCITDGSGSPADPAPDVYAQLMELLNERIGIWYPTVDDAGNMSWAKSDTEVAPAPTNIKGQKGDTGATGQTGADGKSAYTYAQDGGYTGTEAEFAAKLAEEIPAVDNSLTQSGQAADAKVVGDRFDSLSEEKVSLPKDESGAIQNGTDGQILQTNGDGTTQWVDRPTGGASSETANIPVTAEKAFAASVLELNHVADNQYVAQHDSVMFEASEDTTLSVGNDNMIGAPYTGKAVASLEPTVAYTEIENGYALSYNDAFTGTENFQSQRFGFRANIENGKTYTIAFKCTSSTVYVYGLTEANTSDGATAAGTFLGTASTVDGKKMLTFTAANTYTMLRIPCVTMPCEITEVTLCEGEAPLEYGSGAESYALSAGEKVWLSGVRKLNCVGAGRFYEAPLALTSLNGIPTKNGAINSCTTGKVWVNMGDSIWTFGANTGGIGTITDYMIALCGGTWHNIATGGTTMASRPGGYAGTYDALDFWKLADAIVAGDYTDAKAAAAELTSNFANIDSIDWSTVNYITVAYGTNDLAFGAEIDNASNLFDTTTICGALRYGVKTINSAYPNIRFKVLGVLYRNADSVSIAKIVECNNALKDAAAYVGAEFVDGYGINAGNSGTFLYDGTHPNANGKARIAETLARSIHDVWYS